MAYFRWNGLTPSGLEEKGLLLAANREAAQLILMYQNIAVLNLKPTRHQTRRSQQQFLHELISKLAIFTSHGLALHQALATLLHQTSSPYNKANILALYQDIRSGVSLADSINTHFPYTSTYVTTLIKSGEESNKINHMLTMITQYLDQQTSLHKKIWSSATPPLLTLIFTCTIIIVLLIGVVPQFEVLFHSLEKPIPQATASLFALAHTLTSSFFYCSMGLIMAGLILLRKIAVQTPALKLFIDDCILRLPIIGHIIIKLELARFFNIIGILSDAALPLHTAAHLAQTSCSNNKITIWLSSITDELKQGKTLIQAVEVIPHQLKLEMHDLLAPTIILGIKQKTLSLITESFEQDAFKLITRITVIIGPTLLILVGALIFAILIFLYLPLFNLANNI